MKKILFLEYPKCSTCKRARQWLEDNHIDFEARHIVEDNPNFEELKQWYQQSKRPLKSFFNTSGLLYKSLDLKNKLPDMNEGKQLVVLASNGMLVKRPMVIAEGLILSGFKELEWQQLR